jgi:DNA-binding MarR family transcriptional regulator
MSGEPKTGADAWLRFWLKFTVRIESAVESGAADLTPSAWRVLVALEIQPDDVEIEALSELCGLSLATTYRCLADLEAVNYIRKRKSSRDARFVERELTKAGRHALGTIFHADGSPR